MPSLPIHWIVARAYCQATEDEGLVAEAVSAAVSGGTASEERVEGQFGNSVAVLSRRVEHAAELRATWDRWTEAKLPRDLLRDLDGRVDDDGVLHFRLDKQEAAQGQIRLRREADAIDVKVKLKAYPAKPEEIRRVARVLVSEAA